MNAHHNNMLCTTRRGFLAGAGALGALALVGCTATDKSPLGSAAATGSAAASGSAGASADPVRTVHMGTMMTEDFLPGWVAQVDELFPGTVDVRISTFQSAQELSSALTSGDIDMAMTDPQVSATLTAGGTPVRLRWIALGATPEQGRFGIMVGPDSQIKTAEDLRGASIGVGSNTVPEYVMDQLLSIEGIDEDGFNKQEIKKLPVRYEMMSSGNIDAAALPATLLALGEINGCTTIMDDAHDADGRNLSQSVVIVREAFEDDEGGRAAVEAVARGWDLAANAINSDPESYRDLLVENANLPEPLKKTYPISTYPVSAKPTCDMIQPQLDWMLSRGYLKDALYFDEETGSFDPVH